MSGYGESGPYVNWPGQDLVLQGLSGAMLSAGRAGEAPTPAGQYLVDASPPPPPSKAALAALLHRERTGEGQLVTVNMLDAITTLQMQELSVFLNAGKPQARSAEPHAHVYIRAPYGAFATADGYIIVSFPQLKKFGELIGEPAFAEMDEEVDGWTRRDEIFRQDPRAAEGQDHRRVARDPARRRHLVRPGLRLRGSRRRPADRPQRHVRRVRPPDRGPRPHAGLPATASPRPRPRCATARR